MVDLNTEITPYVEPEIGDIDVFYDKQESIGISAVGNIQINKT